MKSCYCPIYYNLLTSCCDVTHLPSALIGKCPLKTILPTPPHRRLEGSQPSVKTPILLPRPLHSLIFDNVQNVWLEPEMGFLHFDVTPDSSQKQEYRVSDNL